MLKLSTAMVASIGLEVRQWELILDFWQLPGCGSENWSCVVEGDGGSEMLLVEQLLLIYCIRKHWPNCWSNSL